MKSKKSLIFPKYKNILETLGENIKLARLRRKLTTIQVSERANVARSTLFLIEKGSETVALGAYFNVLVTLGLQDDFLKLASDDVLGRKLQDLELLDKQESDNDIKKEKQTYLMINDKGHVKIGKSHNPKVRESTLQSEQPCVKLFAISYSDVESELHFKYSKNRIRGEWFDLSDVQINMIIEIYDFLKIETK
jgi:transcriptional regulator with XRE-family HTH domain